MPGFMARGAHVLLWAVPLLAASSPFVEEEKVPALHCLQRHATHVERPKGKRRAHRDGLQSKLERQMPGGPSGLPMQRQPQMGVERCGPFKGPADFLRVSLTDSLLLDMAVLRRHRQVPVLVTAMSLDGAYTDEYGFDITRAEPLEDTENNLLQLQLSDDGKSVDVYKPGLGIRTSDLESLEAVTQGLGDGWLGSLERAPCLEEPGAIVVDAQQLIWAGFFAAYIADDAVNFRILEAKAYPKNVDVAVEYLMGDMGPIKVGFSLVLLPQVSMAPRPMDDRLLYFSSEFLDLGYREAPEGEAPNHEVDRGSSTIWRYNLQALPGQQIRVHVDPSVPARWREFFRQGIEAWNAAFEVAGLRNSIRGVLPSDQDWPKDYDISDARFSTISWDLSDEVASMGIAKVDPRSGEIIKSDITMSSGWVKAWLQDLDELAPGLTHDAMPKGPRDRRISMLQTGSRHSAQVRIERGARSARSSANAHLRQVMNHSQLQELLGSGLKSVVMHETGHILGLRHNFKGSLGISLECLQDKACTGEHGLSASVMDYVPPNIPDAEAPDKVHAYSPVVGGYDKLAIAFGYLPLQENRTGPLARELQEILRQAEAYEVCYDQSENGEDPTCMAYDMSKEPITYLEQELQRFATAQRRLFELSVAPGEPYRLYGEAASSMLDRVEMLGHKLVNWIGGIEDRFVHREGKASEAARPAPRMLQQRALALLLRVLRPSASGLLPPEENFPLLVEGASDELRSLDVTGMVHEMIDGILSRLLAPKRLLQIHRQQNLAKKTGQEALSIDEVLGELLGSVLEPGLTLAQNGHHLASQEMDLQLMLVARLKDLYMTTASKAKMDIRSPSMLQEAEESRNPRARDLLVDTVEEAPALREPISYKLLYYLQHARKQTLATLDQLPSPKASGWQRCGGLGQYCQCPQGLARLAAGTGKATSVVSAVKAVANETLCLEEAFQAEPLASEAAGASSKWCECLVPEASPLRSHLALLNREFSAVFCEDFETCESPRVRASPDEKDPPKEKDAHRSKFFSLLGGLVLFLVIAAGLAYVLRPYMR